MSATPLPDLPWASSVTSRVLGFCDYVILESETDSTMDHEVKKINKDAHVDDIAARIVDSVHECKIWAR